MSVLQSGFDRECKERWIGSANPTVNDIEKTNVPHTRMRFRRRLLNEEVKLLRSDLTAGSMSPTELGQYNARMLLSPSRGHARKAEVMRLERMSALSMCECHPNGRTSPPPLELSAGKPGTFAGTVSPSDAHGVWQEGAGMLLLEAELKKGDEQKDFYEGGEGDYAIAGLTCNGNAANSQLRHGQRSGTGRDDNDTNNGSAETGLLREVAHKLARLQIQLEELKLAQDRGTGSTTPQPQARSLVPNTAREALVPRLRRWWVALGLRHKAIPLLAAALLWINCRRAFRLALVATGGKR